MFDLGFGPPVVVLPGIQGRWEWARAGVEALARTHRVVSFSLCDEPTSGFACDPAVGFENYVTQVAAAMDRAGIATATIVGVSFAGLIATEFAARYPDRTSALVLASALSVGWTPEARMRPYLRWPRLLSPVFLLGAAVRLYPEIAAAFPRLGDRLGFVGRNLWQLTRAPLSPSRAAQRVKWATAHQFADPRTIAAPILVLTGEPQLDRVVPVAISRRIMEQQPTAQHLILSRTGHLGIVTRADAFARAVDDFINAVASGTPHASQERQQAS